ncbi:MAG: hypothetical protein KTR31_39745 [Myxococcales bacterium]|nr:hypothetical protein [Myxococcales bacterium]
MNAPSYVSLDDFAASFGEDEDAPPPWVHPNAATPGVVEQLGLRYRLEDILDTVVALQRAERLQDGVYAGPDSMASVYRDVLHAARSLRIPVPPAILAGTSMRLQGCFGTDRRAFLYLSTFFFVERAAIEERLFMTGRLCGHIAARQVTANTIYSLLVDQNGIRSIARRGFGPVLDVVLAPLSLGVRLALSRWHRAAVITADRAGILVCRDVESAAMALMRQTLGKAPELDAATFLEQRRINGGSPGKWTELLAGEPWTHKRIRAMELFSRSALYGELTDQPVEDPLSMDEVNERTTTLLGVSS